jgi:urocanate hydratase
VTKLLHNPWAGGYYPLGISFEEANTMMAETLFIQGESTRKHENTDAINKHTAKEPISLIMEMLFIRSFRRSGYYGRKHIDFKYPLRSRHHGTHVF